MVTLVDLVEVYIESVGTGPLALGQPVPGNRGVEALVDGETYSYSIRQRNEYEAGVGTWVDATSTLVRAPQISSSGNNPIAIRAGASVAFTALAADITGGGPGFSATTISADNVIDTPARVMMTGFERLQLLAVNQLLMTGILADKIYETTAAGIAATDNGDLFLVQGDGDPSFADLYRNVAGTAFYLNVSLPSSAFVQNLADEVATLASRATDVETDIHNLSLVANTGDYQDLTNRPFLGTASAMATVMFATAAQGAKADTAVQPGGLDAFIADVNEATSIAVASAEALAVYSGGYFYESVEDGVADAEVEVGESFIVADTADRVYLAKKTGVDTGEQGAEFLTLSMLQVGLFTSMSSRLIPVGIDQIKTIGYSIKGIGGARYAYDISVDAAYVTDHPRSSFISANGRGFRIAEPEIDAKMLGAMSGQDSAAAIDETMQVAYEAGHKSWTLWAEGTGIYIIEGQGKVDPGDIGSTFQRGVIGWRPDLVGLSNGAELVIKASDHVKNGPGIFGHHYWLHSDLRTCGLLGEWVFNGNMYDAVKNPGGIPFDDGRNEAGVFTEADVYMFQHGVSLYKSSGTVMFGRLTGRNLRGDIVEAGMTSSDVNYIERLEIDFVEGSEVFREGVSIFNVLNWHIKEILWRAGGDGLWVGLIDVERTEQTDRVTNGRIDRITADFTGGLSPPERTPGLTDEIARDAARVQMRRIVTISHFYDGFPGGVFDNKSMNISIGEIIGVQACMDSHNFANVSFGKLTLSMPHTEDLTDHNLIPRNGDTVDAIRIHGAVNDVQTIGLYGITFEHPPRITGHYAHGIWVSNYDDVLIPDGTVIKDVHLSAVRLDACSGRVGYVKAVDCGTASERAFAVDIWGAKGPIFVREPLALDTRSGGARTMQGAVRLNGTASEHVEVHNARNINCFSETVVTNINDAIIYSGNMDAGGPVWGISTPVAFETIVNTLTVQGDILVGDGINHADISIRAPTGKNANLSLVSNGVLQYQLQQTSDGTFQGLQFNGTYTRTDFQIPEGGGFNLPGLYTEPLRLGSGRYWTDASGILFAKNISDPTSDIDGEAVGDQTTGA